MSNVTSLLPALNPQTVAEEQVSVARLSVLLESMYLDHEVDDGDIYLTDGVEYPIWVAVEEETKLLVFFTYFKPDDANSSEWLGRVNDLNSSIRVPQFSLQQGAVWARYWMSFDGGLNVRHFVKMVRRFSGAVKAAMGDFEFTGATEAISQEPELPAA